ncbi:MULTISPECIES: DUF397 domain-containing protein [Streptomyces]|uniref:DUF397 domain-containing protein n=1 Tax=Streptomyces TaxID=1883 RepID=UPI001902FFF9|nr:MULTISPECIES: DUF397 domain-containing protein [unclassified Streptomyces]MCU4746832.1 DUF397 domain-containing protein [Streptomyces sp. G-5]QQN77534.1 DUF397 domain-containing protein [Streptomyces sp. XC 2026]
MPDLVWLKSSFSEPGTENCIELAADPTGSTRIRESASPEVELATTPARLRGLLLAVRRPGPHRSSASSA